MKDINNITKQDKDTLFQTYIDNIDLPETWLKHAKKDFYKSILNRKVELMPYCVVEGLKELKYISIGNKGDLVFDIIGTELCSRLENTIRNNRDKK